MMNETVTEISRPKKPYLVQRIELAGEVRGRNGKKTKVDYRKIKCVHGGVPEVYDGRAVNNAEESGDMRKQFMSYDYMGSSEFEWGAVPRAYWRFLRAFDKKEGSLKVVDMLESVHGQKERFYIFAPNATMDMAVAFLKYVCMSVVKEGRCYMGLKEGLRLDAVLFHETPMNDRTRDQYYIKARNKNDFDHVGWFDLDNAYYIFWDRGDIAQAFSNLHDFGDILSLEAEEVDFRKDFPLGEIPKPNDYFKPLVDAK